MGMTVDLTLPPVETATLRRRALQEAGALILALADAGAPTEPEPRHGYHMTETGFVRLNVAAGEDLVEIGYTAFWALWQNEDLAYHHPHGGHAKFLDLAMIEGADPAFAMVAAAVRAGLAG